jgi:outer membrane lipoprotein carrier protein
LTLCFFFSRPLLWWLLCGAIAVPVQGQDVHQLARSVDDHYNHLRSLQADFNEIYRGEGAEPAWAGA